MTARERNPERSRERILNAALEEFAANGYAGARVEAIARRAGLNKQLISHHFGGKHALYQAVMGERRMRGGGELTPTPERTADTLSAFYERARRDPEWIRVLLWESLEANDDKPGPGGRDQRATRYRERIAWVAAEQEAGRLPDDLDPDLLLLTLLGAALYPVLLPGVCELVTGSAPDSDEFAERYEHHLERLAGHLSARTPAATAGKR